MPYWYDVCSSFQGCEWMTRTTMTMSLLYKYMNHPSYRSLHVHPTKQFQVHFCHLAWPQAPANNKQTTNDRQKFWRSRTTTTTETHPHTPTKLPPLDSPENGNSVQRMLLLLNNAEVEISRAWESKHGRKMDPDRWPNFYRTWGKLATKETSSRVAGRKLFSQSPQWTESLQNGSM